MFRDEVTLFVEAGKGGDGCLSFRREAHLPKGGPDGGNGGDGGNVIFIASKDENSLFPLTRRRFIKSQKGAPGRGRNCEGKKGKDERIPLPLGTIIYALEENSKKKLLVDLSEEGQTFLAARGGKGGKGNKVFASAQHQTPREWEKGEPGGKITLQLELKLIADVGLIGFPNAGKSTLLAKISAAQPKIADYPFTTLEPQLGTVEFQNHFLTFADIPGLIEGASEGKGLGQQFLRHIERTRVLLHVIDLSTFQHDENQYNETQHNKEQSPSSEEASQEEFPDRAAEEAQRLAQQYHKIHRELQSFSPLLSEKPEVIVANKIDLPDTEPILNHLQTILGKEIIPLSGLEGKNLDHLLRRTFEMVQALPKEGEESSEQDKTETPDASSSKSAFLSHLEK